MELTNEEREMLEGKLGNAVKKSMEILVALGEIYGAKRLIDVKSVQVAGVSYKNLGEAGLEFLDEMAKDGKVKIVTTLNPAGMDIEKWQELGIEEGFAKNQKRVIDTFSKMGIITVCTCTPYFVGNNPGFGESVAWSESSAVAFANSVIGAKTNREGGPSALASALTGKTPEYGMHIEKNRQAEVLVNVDAEITETTDFGALGYVIGNDIKNKIPLIRGINKASIEQLKSLSASIATFGGTALFHIEGITPNKTNVPSEKINVSQEDIDKAKKALTDEGEVDFVSIGCPHCSLNELKLVAEKIEGKKAKIPFWITVARPIKNMADLAGYVKIIEDSGAKIVCDTCLVVAPLKGKFNTIATTSAKGCYYGRGSNNFRTKIMSLDNCVKTAVGEK